MNQICIKNKRRKKDGKMKTKNKYLDIITSNMKICDACIDDMGDDIKQRCINKLSDLQSLEESKEKKNKCL